MNFKLPESDAKYKSIVPGENDPIIHVVLGYGGPLSEAPVHILDKVHADGGLIELKKPAKEKEDIADGKSTGKK